MSETPLPPPDTVTVVPLIGETDDQTLDNYKLGLRAMRDVILLGMQGSPALPFLREAFAVLLVTGSMILEDMPPEQRAVRFASMVADHKDHLAEFDYEAKVDDGMLIIGPIFEG